MRAPGFLGAVLIARLTPPFSRDWRAAVKLGDKDRIETLLLTVEALQAQMEDNTRVSKEREAALLEDRRVREEEYRAETTRDTERLQDLTDKLHHTQDLLYDSTRDYLELKYDHRSTERGWAEEKERCVLRPAPCALRPAPCALRPAPRGGGRVGGCGAAAGRSGLPASPAPDRRHCYVGALLLLWTPGCSGASRR